LMIVSENYKRSLVAFTTDMLQSFRKTFIIVFIILGALPIINFIVLISTRISHPEAFITSTNSILGIGFFTMLITLSIAFFVSTCKTEVLSQFVWPINSRVYAVGNFVVMLACALAAVSGVSALLLIEVLPAMILKLVLKDFILVNNLTVQNFIEGFWVSFCHIMFSASFSYFVGMYFFRHKIIIGALALVLANLSSFPAVRAAYSGMYNFIYGKHSSIMLFSLKIWLVILLLHILSYIPLKRMEVRA